MIKVNEFTDVKYDVSDSIATITINRPDRYNALRGRTVDELLAAFKYAWVDNSVGAIILTGAGEKAFCSGGDQKERAATGGYGETETGMFEIESLHKLIRAVPKPVIAAVNGFAIGGGHVLHVLCDLSIAADTAKFGQVGPRVGSFDAGFGTAYLARVVGEKRAREIWFLCEQYDAATAERWGLVNKVVAPHDLMNAAREWAGKISHLSPTALKTLKHSFNADSEHIGGLQSLAFDVLDLYTDTDEAKEGGKAFTEKRAPDFKKFR
ncbi:MAG: enoyl-CoA hydratase-related protein [Candidatus Nanopelagicaceae bacterium]|jgi:dihydroxynaphthoic acid synthetase|nr:1,4-dihydroxy-2-naphthoyl-CoA synthase [Actinomycetota bacterium]